MVRKQDRERWNDWGIGLLLQGDLKGAEYAFHRVTEADPAYPDGWLNVGRALIQEGETERARALRAEGAAAAAPPGPRRVLPVADSESRGRLRRRPRKPDRLRAHSIRATAWSSIRSGRILFLQRRYAEAVARCSATRSTIDPEDVQAHYNLMLCYRGLGRPNWPSREQKLFLRFKADESVAGAHREAAAAQSGRQQ